MRTLAATLVLLCASLVCSDVDGGEWIYFGSDTQGSDFFYDSESMDFSSKNIIRVWKKRVVSEEARKQIVADRTEAGLVTDGYDRLSYSLIREEINCKKRESNILAIYDCTKAGDVISRVNVPGVMRSWQGLLPGSIGDMLRKAVCKMMNTGK